MTFPEKTRRRRNDCQKKKKIKAWREKKETWEWKRIQLHGVEGKIETWEWEKDTIAP